MAELPPDTSRVHEYLRVTFDAIDQGITIFDGSLRLVAWNDRFASMGIAPPEWLTYGAELFDLYVRIASSGVFGPGDPEVLAQTHIEAIKNGPLRPSEVLSPPGGRSILIRRSRLPNGGICATFDDITERVRTEAQLRETEKMDAIGKLTGGVAHDINNILQVIDANLELALEKPPGAAGTHRLMRAALDASHRGANLVRRLLAFARKQSLSPTLTNVGELLFEMQEMLRRLLGETIEIDVTVSGNAGHCHVDRHQLESVVLNLAINARDAMPNGGELSLAASLVTLADDGPLEPGDYIRISVADSGCGMDVATIERAFEPFYTTKPIGEGTGLGLSVAHGFALQSGGHIEIRSRVDGGTRVELYLPKVAAPPAALPTREPRGVPSPATGDPATGDRGAGDRGTVDEPAAPTASADGSETEARSTRRVLLVEDDDNLRPVLVHQLEAMGHETHAAATGPSALALLKRIECPDVLVTDMRLPGGLNGLDLAAAVRARIPEIHVVLMSGYNDSDVLQREDPPPYPYLRKPFRLAQLSRAISGSPQPR